MYRQQASLVLKHSDISANNVSEEAFLDGVGFWKENKIETTWYVDLQQLMGYEMFNQYENFGLRLNQTAFTELNFAVTSYDTQLVARISGLNWLNCSYDIKTSNNNTKAVLGVFNIPGSVAFTNSYSPNVHVLYFKKSSPRVAITIEFTRAIDDLKPDLNVATSLPNACYSFSIFPIVQK